MPLSKASCNPSVALLGAAMEERQETEQGGGGPAGVRGICWCLCCGEFGCDNFRVPFIRVLGSQGLCLAGGSEGAEVR